MKIAASTRGSIVDDHFGHCEAYAVFAVDATNKIEAAEMLPSSQGYGCKRDIAAILQRIGITVMLAGNMGNMCNRAGQAEYLKKNNTEMNISMGLCFSHDMIFNQKSASPVSTLVVKDRINNHHTITSINNLKS